MRLLQPRKERVLRTTPRELTGLSVDVLKRFLKPEEFSALMEQYQTHKKMNGLTTRFDALRQPITDIESQCLIFWLKDEKTGQAEKERELGLNLNGARYRSANAALKLLYRIAQDEEVFEKLIEEYVD